MRILLLVVSLFYFGDGYARSGVSFLRAKTSCLLAKRVGALLATSLIFHKYSIAKADNNRFEDNMPPRKPRDKGRRSPLFGDSERKGESKTPIFDDSRGSGGRSPIFDESNTGGRGNNAP